MGEHAESHEVEVENLFEKANRLCREIRVKAGQANDNESYRNVTEIQQSLDANHAVKTYEMNRLEELHGLYFPKGNASGTEY